MKQIKRETLILPDMVRATKANLREFSISETVIESVIKAYIEAKRDLLLEGKYIYENGISTEGILIRGVTKQFTDKGFTVKIKESVDYSFRQEAIKKLTTDEEFQYRMDFDTDRFLNEGNTEE